MLPQDPTIDVLLRGSDLNGPSDPGIWQSIKVEKRLVKPVERVEERLDYHYLLSWRGQPTIAERAYRPGRFRRVVKKPGTISLGASGWLPEVRALTPYDVTSCVIDPRASRQLWEESGQSKALRLHEHLGLEDMALTHLTALLAMESDRRHDSGKLYRDSLEQAFIIRFLIIASEESTDIAQAHPLPQPVLRRAIEKLERESSSDFSLAELAEDSGYSRAHFSRMFKSATGKTPFQYLRNVRLERARHALGETNDGISEIAAVCGFSSHSHLTRLFIEQYGVTPTSYRRSR